MLFNVWVTTACNLKCRYCYEGRAKAYEFMDLETAKKCCQYIMSFNDPILIIQFHGGEPLLNYDVVQYIVKELLNKKKDYQKIMFGLTTNGILLTREKVRFLAKYMDYGFSISLDGDEFVNDSMRRIQNGGGSYKFVVPKIRMALDITGNIRFRMTFTPETVDRLADSVIHLESIGAKLIVSHPDFFSKDWTKQHLEIYRRELEKLEEISYRQHWSEKGVKVSLLTYEIFKKTRCSGGENSINISPKGELYPCTYLVNMQDYIIGTLTHGIDKKKMKAISKVNDPDIEVCIGCSNYHSCEAVRCRYLNKLLTNDYLCPSPIICAFERENIKFSMR